MRKLAMLVACTAVLLTSCMSLPGSADKQDAGNAAPVSAIPTPSPTPLLLVKQPWKPGRMQNGIQIYWHSTYLHGADLDQRIREQLDYIVGLGANSVGFNFPIYTNGSRPTKTYAGRETPSPTAIGKLVAAAKARHLRVMVRPIIDETNLMTTPGEWRGSLRPRNVSGWFSSYGHTLAPYLAVAQSKHADEFVLGTELSSLQRYTSSWRRLRNTAANTYTGVISYGVNWDGSLSSVPFASLGIDLYPSVHLPDSASIAQLSNALTKWLMQKPASIRQRLAVHEAGIPALSGMYPHPWFWGTTTGPLNLPVQSKWFAASCHAAHNAGLRGIYYWMLDSNVRPAHVNPNKQAKGSFVGRPAATEIQRCFAR